VVKVSVMVTGKLLRLAYCVVLTTGCW